jgi:hypothetical protein
LQIFQQQLEDFILRPPPSGDRAMADALASAIAGQPEAAVDAAGF